MQRLEDPPSHRDGLAELGRVAVALEHADHVVGADLAGEDGGHDAEDFAPVRADPARVADGLARAVNECQATPSIGLARMVAPDEAQLYDLVD